MHVLRNRLSYRLWRLAPRIKERREFHIQSAETHKRPHPLTILGCHSMKIKYNAVCRMEKLVFIDGLISCIEEIVGRLKSDVQHSVARTGQT